MKPSGNRGFAPPGRTALRSRQSTSPRQSRRFFHIRSSPSQMAQAALLYPYYSSFPGTATAGGWEYRQTPPDHSEPGRIIAAAGRKAVRKLSHAAAGFMENPDADTHQLLYAVRAGDPFHYKKAPQKIPAEPFLSLFLAQRIRRNTNFSSFVSQWHTAPYFWQKYRMDWVPRPCPSFGETGKPSSSNRTAVQNGLTISSMRSG